jgi:hypothetical protein
MIIWPGDALVVLVVTNVTLTIRLGVLRMEEMGASDAA